VTTGPGQEGNLHSDIVPRVRQFILANFYVTDESSLTDQGSLLEQGIVDSTGVLEVIGFIEREFGVKVADEEMLPDNLDSIEHIAAYVARKHRNG
jgi:acyl carrier protein